MVFEKEIKALTKAYSKKLDQLHKDNLKNDFIDTGYFITYLQFIRDKLTLTNTETDLQITKLVSLTAAIDIYKQYNDCIYKYFKIDNEEIKPKIDGTQEEVFMAYSKERLELWYKFCEIVKENMPLWEINNDKI